MDCSTPGLPVHHQLLELAQTHVHRVGDAIQHLILCRPLLLLPSIFPRVRVFSNESVFCIRWPKYRSFSFSISPSNEYSGLISFRMDWLDLLAVQGLAPVALVPWPQERTELRGDTRAAPRPLGNHRSVHLAEQMFVLFLEFCLEKKKKTTYGKKKKKKTKTVNLHVVTLLINHFKNSPLALYFRNVHHGQSVSLWPRVLSRFWFSQ